MTKKIELYQKCPTCNGTGGERLPCGKCTRGFIPVYPHIVIRVEDGFASVGAISPADVDVTVDIIDLDDGGVLDDDTPSEDEVRLGRILDKLFPEWEIFDWDVLWAVFSGAYAANYRINREYLRADEISTLEQRFIAEDIDLTTWAVTEVRRVGHDE